MKKYTLGLYEKAMPSVLGWDEKLISAREAGFDFVEISIDETDEKLSRLDMTKEELEAAAADECAGSCAIPNLTEGLDLNE